MEKITSFSSHARVLTLKAFALFLSLFMMQNVAYAQFGCEASVPSFTITIDEDDECIDILDVNPDGICCPDSVPSGGCIELNLTIVEGVCIGLFRDGAIAEGQFFVDNCLNSQSEGINLVPSSPTATTMNIVYCTTDDGSFDFQVCAKPCCTLDVTCPESPGTIMSCLEQVPPPAQTVADFLLLPGAAINDFCDPVTVEGTLVPTTNTGCPGDTIFAAHIYKIKDAFDSVFCTRFYKVVDDIAPFFSPPADTTISCEQGTDPVVTGEMMDVRDNCVGKTVMVDFEDVSGPPLCENTFSISRTWTLEDECGNDTTYVQQITVVDTTGPSFVEAADTLVECQGDTTVASLGMPTMITDNCSVDFEVRHRDEFVTSPCPMAYTVWRIWEVEDQCNNITIDTQTIQVVDTVPPSYILPPNQLLDCAEDTSVAALGSPTGLDDNCHMVSVSHRDVIIPTGQCASNYDFFRIWTMVDECGNTVIDTQRLMVRDNSAPTVVAPGDTLVSCEANLSMANLGRLVDTSDDCSAMLVEVVDDTVSLDCDGTYTLRRTWIVTDECGNSDSDEQIIDVVDTVAPVLIIPSDMLLPCLGDTSTTATGMAMAMDNCADTVMITYVDEITPTACAAEFTIERIWTAVDPCGNEAVDTQIINVDCVEKLGLAKTIFDIDPPSSGNRGNFNITFELVFENDGNTKLHDIQLEDDLKDAFGRTYRGIVAGGEPKVIFSSADTTPTLNAGYDGEADIQIFNGSTGCLRPNQRITVRFTAEINPQGASAPDEVENSAEVSAWGPCLLPVADLSDTGDDPLGANPGELGDTGGSDDPTIIRLACVGPGAPAMACNRHTNISLDENCSLDIPASVILEGEEYRCDDFYELMITDHHGRLIPSPIPGELKGETLYVKVIDAIFGNSCWGTVLIEDKFDPIIECENDTVYCNALDSVPPPVFYDNCDTSPTLTLKRTTKEDLVCDSLYTQRVTKLWQAEDSYGNKAHCEQIIMLRRVLLDSIDYPKDFTLDNNCALACHGVYPLDTNGNPHPSFTMAPSIDGVPLYPYHLHCNVSVDYTDRVLQHGPCVKKIMRLWRVVEWHCSNSAIREVPQLIHIIDDQPPVIDCPTIDYVTTNGGYECEADVDLPPAFVYDSCAMDSVHVDIQYPGGILKNQNGGRITLPYGVHTITYIAYDPCYNSSSCQVEVEVADHTPPVTICDGFTTVGLNEHGEAYLYAETLDDGTYDDCYLDSFAVRRMDLGARCGNPDTLFRPFIRFCCEDVDSMVMVVFRAWDKAGNYNDCMVQVEVQDKVPPIVYCPPNITISCEYHFDMDSLAKHFGTVVQDKADRQPIVISDPNLRADGPLLDGHVLENCPVTIEEMVVDSISQCRTGTILRGFVVTDRQGLQSQCYQRITIQDFDPFDSLDIKWPLNFETDVCGISFHPDSLPEEFGRPMINDDICSLVGMEWEDHVFNFVPDPLVCYKVLRKWKVIDWCDFTMVNGQYVYKKYHFEQIIKVNNNIPPVLTDSCNEKIVCTYDPDCEDGQIELTMGASDDCTDFADLVWEFQVDLDRNGTLDTASTGSGDFADASGFYPIGEHWIYWTFEDQCGNKTTCRQPFIVMNCKPPSAYCKNGLVVDLMPIDTNGDGTIDLGRIDVWANDLDDMSSHPCGNEIVLSFSRDTSDTFRRFTCDSLGMRNVTIYVTDKMTGEFSSCQTFVEVQDNQGSCPRTSGMITGQLATEDDRGIVDVEVSIAGSMNDVNSFDRVYMYDDLARHGDFLITPVKDNHHLNGVSTKDLIILQRHLLGLINFTDPLEYIAADVDNSKDISVRDIVTLRRVLLGTEDHFRGNTSWRFIDKNYVWQDLQDPLLENPTESFRVIDMPMDMVQVDFTGVKIGDLDQSVDPEGIQGNRTRNSQEYPVSISYDANTIQVVAGQESTAAGLQMTLITNEIFIENMEVQAGLIPIESTHVSFDGDKVRISWNGQYDVPVSEGDVLFTIAFESDDALGAVELANFPLRSEWYNSNLESMDITSTVDRQEQMVTIYQNQPNPFDQSTQVAIESSEDLEARFIVYDASGRYFINKELILTRGVNVVEVDHRELSGTGVYYYQVQTLHGAETKKMVLIE